MSFDPETFIKRMSVERLITVLQGLPPNLLVEANAVGNLLITDSEDKRVGYVDFNEEVVELFSVEDTP